MTTHPLSGVYAASLSPLNDDYSINLDAIPALIEYYANRGCHGILMLGTTGEGPSFDRAERQAIWKAAAQARAALPDFRLMAGTGAPSLTETIELNKIAFGLGFDAVVTLPPYYFPNATEDGLLAWFRNVIEASVPDTGWLLGYHIPQVSGIGLSIPLLQTLGQEYPDQFGGLKDSTGDLEHARALVQALPGLAVLVGNDKLVSEALAFGAAGCITAGANLWSPDLRQIYDAYLAGSDTAPLQAQVTAQRAILDEFPPAMPFLKAMLRHFHQLDAGPVRPPLQDLPTDTIQQAIAKFNA